MILADKIINERKKNGWSQEELADMLDVSRQSVSKWEGAQSIPDLSKILKMAEIFGVSTDYLLKDEMEPESNSVVPYYEQNDAISSLKRVSMEEASEFITTRKEVLPKIGLGVFLCITCPVVLILLAGLQNAGIIGITENVAAAIGLIFLFAQIGTAVWLFVSKGGKLGKYEFMEKEAFDTEYGVDGMVKERMAASEPYNTKALTTGVLLCVLGSVPLVITSVLGAPEVVIVSMVALLLLLVGCAVYMFVSVCGVHSSYKILLQTDDYSYENKKKNNKLEPLTRIYWLAIVVIYLAVSFLTGRWDMTWIIWAVSGVLFALIRVIGESLINTRD
ncbi:MAG: helix-turn-helix transcriptional regulator [Lachnospiraceae bacterium]|nr:helix-turn-helix transcriptional regulator [Lachnospiraceae bacterium]